MALTLAPGKQRQMHLYEFEVSLIYRVKFQARKGNTVRIFLKTTKQISLKTTKLKQTQKPICKKDVPSMLATFAEGIGCAKVFLLGCCVLVC